MIPDELMIYRANRRRFKKWAGKARRRARKEARQQFDQAGAARFRLVVQERRAAARAKGRRMVPLVGRLIGGWNVRPSRWPE